MCVREKCSVHFFSYERSPDGFFAGLEKVVLLICEKKNDEIVGVGDFLVMVVME